jgi:hypothetical protein
LRLSLQHKQASCARQGDVRQIDAAAWNVTFVASSALLPFGTAGSKMRKILTHG